MDYFTKVVKAANRGDPIPPEPEWNKWIHKNLSENHCLRCLKLHECWFAKSLTPKWPHHEHCHCVLENLPYVNVMYNSTAECAYSKIDPYLFNTNGKQTHHKEEMLNDWGYTVADAKWLQSEIEKQGLEKYICGDYFLNKLDLNGQRINIRVEIPRKDKKGTVSFITGRMVEPNGHIRLITPYGDN